MPLALLTLHLRLPGCASLKEKRSRLLPLLNRLRREFNVSVAEIEAQDAWQRAIVGCAMLNTDAGRLDRALRQLVHWVETNWPEGEVVDDQIEIM